MEHISNMEYSLDAIKYIVELQVAKGLPSVDIHYKATYPFCDEVAYKQEVEDCLVKHNNDFLMKILKQHLSTCEEIIEIWDKREEFWEARSGLTMFRVDDSFSYKIYCTLGGRRNNIRRFYGDIMLLRENNEKVEIGNPYMWNIMSWSEYNPEERPQPSTDRDKETMAARLVHFAKDIKRFLNEWISEEESLPMIEQPQPQAIPKELDTEEALAIFKRAVDANLMEQQTIGYKWLKSKALLAYFVEVANDKLDLKHGQKRKIKPFETIFHETRLGGCINEYKKTGQLPIGHKIIDKIFDNTLI